MATSNSPDREATPPDRRRSTRFWITTFLFPLVLLFAGLGIISALERWGPSWSPPIEHPKVERAGFPPWVEKKWRANAQQEIDRIERDMPVVVAELQHLQGLLDKTESLAEDDPQARAHVASLRRMQAFLTARLEAMRDERAYYIRELAEK
jgi:hypothetical protein